MKDRLSGGRADVDANVVALGRVNLLDLTLGSIDCFDQSELFFAAGFRPGRDVTTGNNQGVAR